MNEWIKNKVKNHAGKFFTGLVTSILGAIIYESGINWLKEHWPTLILTSLSLYIGWLLGTYLLEKRRKERQTIKENMQSLRDHIFRLEKKLEANKEFYNKEVEKIDTAAGSNWQHISDIISSLNKLLKKAGEETLNTQKNFPKN